MCLVCFFCYYIIRLSRCPLCWEWARQRKRMCRGRQPGLGLWKVLFFTEFLEQMVHKQYSGPPGAGQEERHIIAQWDSERRHCGCEYKMCTVCVISFPFWGLIPQEVPFLPIYDLPTTSPCCCRYLLVCVHDGELWDNHISHLACDPIPNPSPRLAPSEWKMLPSGVSLDWGVTLVIMGNRSTVLLIYLPPCLLFCALLHTHTHTHSGKHIPTLGTSRDSMGLFQACCLDTVPLISAPALLCHAGVPRNSNTELEWGEWEA